jgi:hypothetical protein
MVYRFVPGFTGCWDISTCTQQTPLDTVVYVREGDCASGTERGCNDDFVGCGTKSRVFAELLAGQTYFIVVDAFGEEGGQFVLSVFPCLID